MCVPISVSIQICFAPPSRNYEEDTPVESLTAVHSSHFLHLFFKVHIYSNSFDWKVFAFIDDWQEHSVTDFPEHGYGKS